MIKPDDGPGMSLAHELSRADHRDKPRPDHPPQVDLVGGSYTSCHLYDEKGQLFPDVVNLSDEQFNRLALGGADLGPPEVGYVPEYKRSLLDGMTSAQRKEYPITTGCIDYFRDALLLVSHVSYKGNQKHNPGEPLHWARAKSADEEDAIGRHLLNRYETDPEIGLEEASQLAWRALAFLQKLVEKKCNIKPPVGCQ